VLVVVACETGFETSKMRYELGPCHYEGLEIASGSRCCSDGLVLVQTQIASTTLTSTSTSCMNVPCSFDQVSGKAIDLGQQPCVVFENEIGIASRKSLCRTNSWIRNQSLNPLQLQEQAKRAWACSEGVFASLL
jgi:hypothetical protein